MSVLTVFQVSVVLQKHGAEALRMRDHSAQQKHRTCAVAAALLSLTPCVAAEFVCGRLAEARAALAEHSRTLGLVDCANHKSMTAAVDSSDCECLIGECS